MSKVIRSYRLIGDVLHCNVDFLPDDVDFIDDHNWSATGPDLRMIHLSAIVGPSSSRKDDFKVDSMNCSRSLVFDEIQRFCQTIKHMYDL